MGKDHPDADLHPEATGLAALTVKVPSVAPNSDIHYTNVARLTPPNTPSSSTVGGSVLVCETLLVTPLNC
jgi:hypothetical protein